MKGYQLKITVKGSSPPIWRRVVVPSGITFADLDQIIEYLFGWTHSHLYDFRILDEDLLIIEEPDSYYEEEANVEIIDDYFYETAKINYTYDFGDCWEHTILVEKEVDYDENFPIVLKSKGPNLIEDCGGIHEFYNVIDMAEPFEIDVANRYMKEHMLFQRNDSYKNVIDMPNQSEDALLEKIREWEEEGEEVFQTFEEFHEKLIESYVQNFSLEDIFQDYSKREIIEMVKENHFSGYSSFKKMELVKWFVEKIMDNSYMEQIIRQSSKTEVELFEKVIQEGHLLCPIELLEHVGILFQYCGYIHGYLIVPNDVKKNYKKICKNAPWKKERDRKWKIQSYIRSCIDFYGVLSFKDIADIYKHYEKRTVTEEELRQLSEEVSEQEEWSVKEELLMDEALAEDQMYQFVLQEQSGLPYYMPKSKEEFLDGKLLGGEDVDILIQGFAQFLRTNMFVSLHESQTMILLVEDMLRHNRSIEEIKNTILRFKDQKVNKRLEGELVGFLMCFSDCTRRWENKGFTPFEREEMDEKKKRTGLKTLSSQAYEETMKIDNVIPFEKEKKIYPNDPCPCGSGKKYKHCCGRKK